MTELAETHSIHEAKTPSFAEIEGTGGRHDFFFFVKNADVPKFALKRFRFGMRWWTDVFFNDGEGIYPIEFRNAYPYE